MKKLMFMLGTVAVAACAQAASVYWTCTYVAKGAENYVDNGLAFFVNASTLSQADMLALNGKGADAISSALSGFYSYSGGADGKYSVAKDAAVANATLGLADATASQAYLVIFDTATITDASKFYVTDVESFNTLSGTETKAVKWGDQEDRSSAAGAWSSVKAADPEPPIDSPEPTSGLLMLIGAAGLALRRKRA